jgi:hypothetical protein
MKLKTLALAVAILAVLSLAAYYLQRPPAPAGADPRTDQPVFDAKVLEKAARIRLTDQGRTVVLARQPDGRWSVPSYYDLPADLSKLSRFIDDLSSARIQRLVTRNPERLARLEFKDASVALLDPADKALWTLALGKEAEGGGRFIRFDDETRGYQANLAVFLDSTARNWADTLLVDLKPDDVAEVEITFGDDAPVKATRARKEDAWVAEKAPPGLRIRGDRIPSLLSTCTGIRFQDTSDLTDANVGAARKHLRTVRLATFDHRTITVELGRKPEEAIVKPAETAKNAPAPAASTAGNAVAKGETAAGTSAPEIAVSAQAKPEEPKTETIPAGPVYAFVASSDSGAAVNALMKKRAFQTFDWNFTSLPQKRDELFEPVPAPPPPEEKTDAAPAPGKAGVTPPAPPAAPTPGAGPAEKPAVTPKN